MFHVPERYLIFIHNIIAMKKLIIMLAGVILSITLSAQTWKVPIYNLTGKPVVKSLKLKQEMPVEIGSLHKENETLKESKYLNGTFLGVVNDSMQIILKEVKINSIFENGNRSISYIAAKNYAMPQVDSSIRFSIALQDIHILRYQTKIREKAAMIEDFVLFSSLATILVTPILSYKDKEFNSVLYKNLAIGSTIGLVVGVSLQMMGGKKSIQFKSGWPSKKAKVWSFSNKK
jgi:hypothetical protein